MPISLNKYINIVSGIGAGATVATRELIGRIFTINPLLPPQSFVEFTNPSDVGVYFGTTSAEYARALQYFSFINKNITQANKISFARWVETNQAPMIFGQTLTTTLSAFQLITAGAFSLTLGAQTNIINNLNFSGAASLANVAALLQAGINAQTGAEWAEATVTYDAQTGGFNFVGGSAVAAIINVQSPGSGTDISTLIGWAPQAINGAFGAIWSDGALAETLTTSLTNSAQASDNFGSFLFMPTLNLAQITEIATWNAAQNFLYQFHEQVSVANASTYSAALINLSGMSLTVAPLTTEFPEQLPMQILATTDYSRANSTQNYMYQQANLTPSISDTADSNTLDSLRINYYGSTQTAGQIISFYQRGVLMGNAATAATDMNVYANEQWFKSAASAALLQLLLSLTKVSANPVGRGQVMAVLQSIISQALLNNTISPGKELSTTQILYINQITNDLNAWRQVQSAGYWINCFITSTITSDARTEYNANYILVYGKDDVIRKINGTDVLI